MDINIGTTNTGESNEFLRCLWTEMKKEFGVCGWHYTPYKNGLLKKITFGFVNIGESKPLEVGITYKEKGSINNIVFKAEYGEKELKKGTELYQRLKSVVNTAKQNVGKVDTLYFSTAFQSYYPFNSCRTDNFTIHPMKDNKSEFIFGVKAYDRNQASGFVAQKVTQLMNFLAVETNAVFDRVNWVENRLVEPNESELFQEEDFIDDYSVKENYLVISEEGKEFINILTNSEQELSPEVELFLKACGHFHSARKQEEKMFRRDLDGSVVMVQSGEETEIATTLYLSALEVTTLIGFTEEKCDSCGQPKFQITRRVRELASRYLPKHLAKDFVDYYDKRSKYLHAGMRLNTETPTGNLIPLLDPDEKSGCESLSKIPLINVREYVSYCLRKFYRENLINN
ncbi:hypothetical protein MOE47_04105 [Bacillus atrophaeus]|uniref:hypothetical protein n=1 Tax=Bacillus atrophaeus TaxID=1452 RepID=UPI00227E4351|nr:hypothetical protein [Bacillus atrophaeus]MCY8913410.1 hypothetical protein [Bacillus atrophaeus]MCY9113632.1 hypothetical protein [Bacillus atrophaeus]MEC0925866.1 hypothetical protein [Bacillus atrophaeus]MEC0933982.1 hypothetical protein [Bacillus atrophaeus]